MRTRIAAIAAMCVVAAGAAIPASADNVKNGGVAPPVYSGGSINKNNGAFVVHCKAFDGGKSTFVFTASGDFSGGGTCLN
jgi:hypothetical protein